MQVKEIMSTEVQRIHQSASVREAAAQMKNFDVGMIPVYDGDRLVGTLTDRDIAMGVVANSRDPEKTKISEIMSPGVTYCFEDQDISEAAKLMADEQIRRLIVLDRNKRLVGITSLGDLATRPAAKGPAVDALEDISKPSA